MNADQVAEVGFYLDQQAAGREQISANVSARVEAGWAGFDGWYDDQKVALQATASADLVRHARDVTTGLNTAFIAHTVAVLRGTHPTPTPVQLPPDRGSTSLEAVYTRPAKRFRFQISRGASREVALGAAQLAARTSAATDVMLAVRDSAQMAYRAHHVTGYRRVLRPEFSKSGPCGLCAAASDRIYKTSQLAPIHLRCVCETLPVVGADDPGRSLNDEELNDLYTRAGSTSGADLKRIPYKVNTHSELGPVLSLSDHNFRKRDALIASAIEVAEDLVRGGAA